MLTIGMMFLSSFLSMNLFVCAEAGITFTAHIVKFRPPFCCDPYCCNPPWQLKAVRGWFSVYRSQNVCQTFLTLHHSLGELHQPHSIFRLWEIPMTHHRCPQWSVMVKPDICRVSHALELTPSVGKVFVTAATGFSWPSNDLPSLNLTAPLGFPWPGWPHHLLTWQLP